MRRAGASRGIIVLAVLVAVVACRSQRTQSSDLVARADTDARARARAVNVHLAAVAGLRRPGPRVRVLVSPRGIDVDNAAQLATRRLDASAAAGLLVVRHDVVSLENGAVPAQYKRGGANGFLIEPLAAVGRDLAAREARYWGEREHAVDRSVNVYVDRTVPWRTLYEVAYSLGQVGFDDFAIVLREQSGAEVALPMPAASAGVVGRGSQSRRCAQVQVRVEPAGVARVWLRVGDGNRVTTGELAALSESAQRVLASLGQDATADASVGDLPAPAPAPGEFGTDLGSVHEIPARESHVDTAALTAALGALHPSLPLCPAAMISSSATVAADEELAAQEVLVAHGGFARVLVGLAM